jgi:ABC-2 type transport system ATP-binding protein
VTRSDSVIAVEDLVFDYSGKRALDGVSFGVTQGAVVALVGPNGAGKTTLLRCIAGLQEPLAGSVSVAGIHVATRRSESHRYVGYVSDFFGLYDALSARRCLLYMATTHGLRGDAAERAVERAAGRVGIQAQLSAAAGTLSRGLRQRLAIAMALVHEPKVLLLDEPAAGLDPEARHRLASLMTELRVQGTTLIVSSHLLSELEDYSTEMLVLDAGRIVERCAIRSQAAKSYVMELVSDRESALAALQKVAEVRDPRVELECIRFECDGDKHFVADLLRSLVQQGILFASFQERTQDMQQLYLASLARERGLST